MEIFPVAQTSVKEKVEPRLPPFIIPEQSLQQCPWTPTLTNPGHNNPTPVRDPHLSVGRRMDSFLLFIDSNVPLQKKEISAVDCWLLELPFL